RLRLACAVSLGRHLLALALLMSVLPKPDVVRVPTPAWSRRSTLPPRRRRQRLIHPAPTFGTACPCFQRTIERTRYDNYDYGIISIPAGGVGSRAGPEGAIRQQHLHFSNRNLVVRAGRHMLCT